MGFLEACVITPFIKFLLSEEIFTLSLAVCLFVFHLFFFSFPVCDFWMNLVFDALFMQKVGTCFLIGAKFSELCLWFLVGFGWLWNVGVIISCIINTKNYWKYQRDCAWSCARRINTTWKICRSTKSTNQKGVRSAHRTDLCFSICRFFHMVFILRAQPHAQSLCYFQ